MRSPAGQGLASAKDGVLAEHRTGSCLASLLTPALPRLLLCFPPAYGDALLCENKPSLSPPPTPPGYPRCGHNSEGIFQTQGLRSLLYPLASSFHHLALDHDSAKPRRQIPVLPAALSSGRFPHWHPGCPAPWEPPTSLFFCLLSFFLISLPPSILPAHLSPWPSL